MSIIIGNNSASTLKAILLAFLLWQVLIIIDEDSFAGAQILSPKKDQSRVIYSQWDTSDPNNELEYPANEITGKYRRRISGFVPMRGKKDSLVGSLPVPTSYIEQAPREMDQEATISRLATMGRTMSNQANQLAGPDSDELASGNGNSNWQPVVAVPRQFFYQMTNHRQESQQADNNGASWQRGLSEFTGQEPGNPVLMEMKYRRGFHPMRGKRTTQIEQSD